MIGPDGQHDEPWAGGPASGSGAAAADDRFDPGDDAERLDLDDEDPPLPWLQGDDDDDDGGYGPSAL